MLIIIFYPNYIPIVLAQGCPTFSEGGLKKNILVAGHIAKFNLSYGPQHQYFLN